MENKKILVVDDVPENLQLLEEVLSGADYHVQLFPTGSLALQAAIANPPDLILLDVLMPELSGYELCRQLKAIPALEDIPVIFISALDTPEDKINAFSAGGVDYISKPFQEDEVLARVNLQLKLQCLHKTLEQTNSRLEEKVQERTRELDLANQRLQKLGKLKTDFLTMFSHEIRTPAHGLLGAAELLITEESDPWLVELFSKSEKRITRLIEDAELIATLDGSLAACPNELPLPELLRLLHREESIKDLSPDPKGFSVQADLSLLKRALQTIEELVCCFQVTGPSDTKQPLPLPLVRILNSWVVAEFPLTEFRLSTEELRNFFCVASMQRSSTRAEQLGISPVAAFVILRSLGGSLDLRRLNPSQGMLTLKLPLSKVL